MIGEKRYKESNDLWFFEEKYCEGITFEERANILVLTKSYSKDQWNKFVSEKHRHLMLVKDDHEWKLRKEKVLEYKWVDDWNNNVHRAFLDNISPVVGWNNSDEVIFFWDMYSSVQTKWCLVCKYWMAFLYDDEMNVIINPKSEKAIIIGVNGYVSLVRRN